MSPRPAPPTCARARSRSHLYHPRAAPVPPPAYTTMSTSSIEAKLPSVADNHLDDKHAEKPAAYEGERDKPRVQVYEIEHPEQQPHDVFAEEGTTMRRMNWKEGAVVAAKAQIGSTSFPAFSPLALACNTPPSPLLAAECPVFDCMLTATPATAQSASSVSRAPLVCSASCLALYPSCFCAPLLHCLRGTLPKSACATRRSTPSATLGT